MVDWRCPCKKERQKTAPVGVVDVIIRRILEAEPVEKLQLDASSGLPWRGVIDVTLLTTGCQAARQTTAVTGRFEHAF